MPDNNKVPITKIRDFFGMKTQEFSKEWMHGGLTEKDKEEIRKGFDDGTMTY